MKNIWRFIIEKLDKQQIVYLMICIQNQGSSPGKQGFKMTVAEDGSLYGSIGGGIMEHLLVEKARKLLAENISEIFLLKQNHHPDAISDNSGMICSGQQTVAFIPLSIDHLSTIQEISIAVENNKAGLLSLSDKQLNFENNKKFENSFELNFQSHDKWEYREELGRVDQLFIFGGGHVGLALSQIFSMLNFHISIFDDRVNLNTFDDNQYANAKKIIDYENVAKLVPEGVNTYAVVMTTAHKHDEVVVRQLVSKNIKYLGMIGSKKKVKTIFDKLHAEDIDPNLTAKIDAPIGLKIGSETPAEIAVSIAAKIISVKHE